MITPTITAQGLSLLCKACHGAYASVKPDSSKADNNLLANLKIALPALPKLFTKAKAISGDLDKAKVITFAKSFSKADTYTFSLIADFNTPINHYDFSTVIDNSSSVFIGIDANSKFSPIYALPTIIINECMQRRHSGFITFKTDDNRMDILKGLNAFISTTMLNSYIPASVYINLVIEQAIDNALIKATPRSTITISFKFNMGNGWNYAHPDTDANLTISEKMQRYFVIDHVDLT